MDDFADPDVCRNPNESNLTTCYVLSPCVRDDCAVPVMILDLLLMRRFVSRWPGTIAVVVLNLVLASPASIFIGFSESLAVTE